MSKKKNMKKPPYMNRTAKNDSDLLPFWTTETPKKKKEFPSTFPFWARLKISKKRTTLVIDEEQIIDKKSKKTEDGFVHREVTHTYKQEFEELNPNPDKTDNRPMYLKRPTKLPKRLFEPHNKELDMPQSLKDRYDKNNKKK